MNLYDNIRHANILTNELEDIENIINTLQGSELIAVISRHPGTDYSGSKQLPHHLDKLVKEGPQKAYEFLQMSNEFYKEQLIKYYTMRKDDIIKEINNLMNINHKI